MPRLLPSAALAAGLLLSPQAAWAQRGTDAGPARGPGWLARVSNSDAGYFTHRPPPAAQAEMRARLLEIQRIVLGVAELARPANFEVQPLLYPAGWPAADKRLVLQADLDFYPPRRSPVEACWITITITARGTGDTPEVRSALMVASRKLDGVALARLLEPAG